jgi:hypothetical protein
LEIWAIVSGLIQGRCSISALKHQCERFPWEVEKAMGGKILKKTKRHNRSIFVSQANPLFSLFTIQKLGSAGDRNNPTLLKRAF